MNYHPLKNLVMQNNFSKTSILINFRTMNFWSDAKSLGGFCGVGINKYLYMYYNVACKGAVSIDGYWGGGIGRKNSGALTTCPPRHRRAENPWGKMLNLYCFYLRLVSMQHTRKESPANIFGTLKGLSPCFWSQKTRTLSLTRDPPESQFLIVNTYTVD